VPSVTYESGWIRLPPWDIVFDYAFCSLLYMCLGHLLVIVELFLHLPARLLVQSVLYES